MQNVLTIIYYILFAVVEIYILSTGILAIIGLFPHRQRYAMRADETRFCVFIPCHNEGAVIASTVADHARICYDADKFDLYYIADNCTDDTAEHIKDAIALTGRTNLHLLVRTETDPTKRGKPHALRWAMDKLEEEGGFYGRYDMFMILDADNFADKDILRHINSQALSYPAEKRPAVIQAYLDSKNCDSLVARGYYTGYRVSNRCAQASRHFLGLNPAVGGTGFACSTAFLRKMGGYTCRSLTEDLELQTIATLMGERIVFNGNTRVYDEKPTRFKQSLIQRIRWSQGHWYNFFKYGGRMLIRAFDPRRPRAMGRRLDMVVYLATMLVVFLTVLMPLYTGLLMLLGYPIPPIPEPLGTVNLVLGAVTAVLVIPVTALYDGTQREKRRILIDFLPNVLAVLLLSVIVTIAAVAGLFLCGNQKTWRKTSHCVVSMERPMVAAEQNK
ncbi:MAG: glycosyltransferase family 2 protein [Eubacteriales bacterium]|nr:glycosyltransferase family 2 protein [Eubacteriales bacterium]